MQITLNTKLISNQENFEILLTEFSPSEKVAKWTGSRYDLTVGPTPGIHSLVRVDTKLPRMIAFYILSSVMSKIDEFLVMCDVGREP
jgi:hypothetical protein